MTKWVARSQKRLALGLPTAVLVLAVSSGIAQAQQASNVALSSIDAVASFRQLPDGSVEITLKNGQIVTLGADAVVVAPDGTLLVAAATGESIAALAIGAEFAGAGLAVVVGGLAVAAGAGASGGGGSSDSGQVVGSSGVVIDGYIAGATVFRDMNENGVLDPGEFSVTTDDDGKFTDLQGEGGRLIAVGGIDISTGQEFTGVLKAPGDATVITPLTTLVQAILDSDETASAADATRQVADALGLGDFDILTTDPIATDNLDAFKAGAQVAAIFSAVTAAAETDEDRATLVSEAAKSLKGKPLNEETIAAAIEAALGAGSESIAAAVSAAVAAIGAADNPEDIIAAQTIVQGALVQAIRDEKIAEFDFDTALEDLRSEDPTDPGEEPVDPVDPTDPGEEPVDPVDPTDPGEEPVDPVDPTDPGEEPVDPVDPTDPGEEPVDPTTQLAAIGSASSLAEMQTALQSFAEIRDDLSIPEARLNQLAGDVMIYRPSEVTLEWSGVILDTDQINGLGLSTGQTLSGKFVFKLPLGAHGPDRIARFDDPEDVFQFEQLAVDGSEVSIDIPGLRLSQPNLSLNSFVFNPEDLEQELAEITELVGEDLAAQFIPGAVFSQLQIWLSAVDGEADSITGIEIGMSLVLPGEPGLAAFLDQLGTIPLRLLEIRDTENGENIATSIIRVDELQSTLVGSAPDSADLFAGLLNAFIGFRDALDEAVVAANDGALTVAALQAVQDAVTPIFGLLGGDGDSDDESFFAAPFLGDQMISQAAGVRVEAFLEGLDENQQVSFLAAFNAQEGNYANFADILNSAQFKALSVGGEGDGDTGSGITDPGSGDDGDDTGGAGPRLQFDDEDLYGHPWGRISIDGEIVDVTALVRGIVGDTATEDFNVEVIDVAGSVGLFLPDGRIALQVYVEGIADIPLTEDWIVTLNPDGTLDQFVRDEFAGGEGQKVFFPNLISDAGGIVLVVVNLTLENETLTQGDPLFTTYLLTPEVLGGIELLTLESVIAAATQIKQVTRADLEELTQETDLVIPNLVSVDFAEDGSALVRMLLAVGEFEEEDGEPVLNVTNTLFLDASGEFTSLGGDVIADELIFSNGELIGALIGVEVITELSDGSFATQLNVFRFDAGAESLTLLQSNAFDGGNSIFGSGLGEVIFAVDGNEVFLPVGDAAGPETVLIDIRGISTPVQISGFELGDSLAFFGPQVAKGVLAPQLITFDGDPDDLDSFVSDLVTPDTINAFVFDTETGSALFITEGRDGVVVAEFDNTPAAQLVGIDISILSSDDVLTNLPT